MDSLLEFMNPCWDYLLNAERKQTSNKIKEFSDLNLPFSSM